MTFREKTKTTTIGEPTPPERKKRKASSPNPLSHKKAREVSSYLLHQPPTLILSLQDSQTTKKKKMERFIRGSH
jgi:hypothetical protein